MNENQKMWIALGKTVFKYLVICFIWNMLELVLYGMRITSVEDTIISFILYYYIFQSEYRKLDML